MGGKLFMRRLALLIIPLLLLTIVNAEQQTLGTFKLNSCIDLIQTCGNCTSINISNILYPNSSIALGFAAMTGSNGYFNYTFCKANVTGNYTLNGKADIDGLDTTWAYDLKVTHGGKTLTSQESSIYIIIIIALFFFLILGIFGTAKSPWKNGYTREGYLVSVNDLKP